MSLSIMLPFFIFDSNSAVVISCSENTFKNLILAVKQFLETQVKLCGGFFSAADLHVNVGSGLKKT